MTSALVQTALLPFLLPSSPLERALYMPYNPPRDVCVSAPTGSGKTLAYAIPIIEVSGLVYSSLVLIPNSAFSFLLPALSPVYVH